MSLQGSGCVFMVGFLLCALCWGFAGALWWTVASVIVTLLGADQ